MKKKLAAFPKITNPDRKKLYELSDLLSEVDTAMQNPAFKTVLSYFNSSTGVNPIIQKLPHHIQGKWTERATKYMRTNAVTYPPFSVLHDFVHQQSSMLNNPCFVYENTNERSTNVTPKVTTGLKK